MSELILGLSIFGHPTPQIFYKAKPKFDLVHQSSDTYWFLIKYFKAAGQLQHFLEAKKIKEKNEKMLKMFFFKILFLLEKFKITILDHLYMLNT